MTLEFVENRSLVATLTADIFPPVGGEIQPREAIWLGSQFRGILGSVPDGNSAPWRGGFAPCSKRPPTVVEGEVVDPGDEPCRGQLSRRHGPTDVTVTRYTAQLYDSPSPLAVEGIDAAAPEFPPQGRGRGYAIMFQMHESRLKTGENSVSHHT